MRRIITHSLNMYLYVLHVFVSTFLYYSETESLHLSKESQKNFPETITVCLLNAMKLDSMEARQRFPRLLQLVERYPDIRSTFVEKVFLSSFSFFSKITLVSDKLNNYGITHTFITLDFTSLVKIYQSGIIFKNGQFIYC